jgi:hypothetical protein
MITRHVGLFIAATMLSGCAALNETDCDANWITVWAANKPGEVIKDTKLDPGVSYRIEVQPGQWRDSWIDSDVEGMPYLLGGWLGHFGVYSKANLFQMVCEVNSGTPNEPVRVAVTSDGQTRIGSSTGGALSCYPNDWKNFYCNNKGRLCIKLVP